VLIDCAVKVFHIEVSTAVSEAANSGNSRKCRFKTTLRSPTWYLFMKIIVSILVLFLSGCDSQVNTSTSTQVDSNGVQNISASERSQFYAKDASVVISSKHFETIRYSKEDFDLIVDNFPLLYLSIPIHPDISYAQSGFFRDIIDSNGNSKHLSFGSEQGQDKYYILYSYFLRQKQSENKFDTIRENLISIYQHINDIFSRLVNGGTYFGHQYYRINGYAEYGVYEFRQFADTYNDLTDIQTLKQLYIASLKELIHRRIEADKDLPHRKDRVNKENELSRHVAALDKLIGDNFYLKKAQQFQYSYY
jgi:hypothetical protein